jgi:hypothetical protein
MKIDIGETYYRSPLVLPRLLGDLSEFVVGFHDVVRRAGRLPLWHRADPIHWWLPPEMDPFWKLEGHTRATQLSSRYRPSGGTWSDHTLIESAVEPSFRRRLRTLGSSDASLFVELVCEVNRVSGRGTGLIRTEDVGNSGRDGSRIIFPSYTLVYEGLLSLWDWICETELPSFIHAIVAFCAVTNLHPFTDGNGRSARWLFCSILFRDQGTGDDFYPLYEYFVRDQGISTLALRKAEVLGDWRPLASYLLDVMSEMIRRRVDVSARAKRSDVE